MIIRDLSQVEDKRKADQEVLRKLVISHLISKILSCFSKNRNASETHPHCHTENLQLVSYSAPSGAGK
jgi:hypothetical protein